MPKGKNERVAEKLIDLFSDNRMTLADWKFFVPSYIFNHQTSIIANAISFADGIKQYATEYGIDLPEDYVVAFRDDHAYAWEKGVSRV